METSKDLGKDFPSVLDRAYTQYKRERAQYRKVVEIMSREVITTTPETKLDEAARLMGEKHIGSVIVVAYDTPVGILTERDLLSKVFLSKKDSSKETIEKYMSYPLISICSTAQIKEAAQMMIKKKGRLAVFKCGQLIGIITASDLVHSIPAVSETAVKVDDFMTKKLITVDEKTLVDTVVQIMGKERIGSVIITHKGESVGIFTERDLLSKFLAKRKQLDVRVGTVCTKPLVTASSGISAHKAAYVMTAKHIRRLPIVKEKKVVGIITARDLVEVYSK